MRKKNEHQIKCYEMMNNIFHKPLDIYVRIEDFDDTENIQGIYDETDEYIRFEIITEEMLKYDGISLTGQSEIRTSDYRPYFVSFLCSVEENSKEDLYEKYRGRWHKAHLAKKQDIAQSVSGKLEFSASPIIYRKCKLVIEDKEIDSKFVDLIERTYQLSKPKNDEEIRVELENVLGEVIPKYAMIYKVGHGNMIELNFESPNILKAFSKRMFFDIGYNSGRIKTCSRRKYNGAIKMFSNRAKETDVVMISHWDADHIMGCCYAPRDIFERTWFAPEFLSGSSKINARRLAAYVDRVGVLNLIKRTSYDREISLSVKYDYIKVYVGSGKSSNKIGSKENNSGILIETITDNKDTLFHGDTAYDCVYESIWSKRVVGFDNLIVPHHGSSKMNCDIINEYTGSGVGKAIISVGEKNSKRPDILHMCKLCCKNYKIEITEDQILSYIKIEL